MEEYSSTDQDSGGGEPDRGLLSMEEVMRSAAGNPDTAQKLLGLILQNMPTLLEDLERGIATGNIEAAERGAHTIKSQAAYIGASRLRSASADFEQLAKSASADELSAAYQSLREYADATLAKVALQLERMSDVPQDEEPTPQ